MQVLVETLAQGFRSLFQTSQAPAALAPLVIQNRDPAQLVGQAAGLLGVRSLEASGKDQANFGKFAFFGTGASTTNFNVLIVGWQSVSVVPGQAPQWIPIPLANLLVTLGTLVGPAAGVPFSNSVRMATTIAVNGGIIDPSAVITVPDATNDQIAILKMDLSGYERLQAFIGTGTATTANVLFSGF